MVSQIYPTELQLNNANSFEAKAPFMDMDLISSNNYDKRDDLNFEPINFPFLDEDVPRPLPIVCIFCSLFILQEYALMLLTSTAETDFFISKLLNKAINIINFVKHFLNSITDNLN